MAVSTHLIAMAAVGVLLQLHLIDAQFTAPKTACPLTNTNCTDDTASCTGNTDCDELSWCCPNSCGGESCAVVMAPCIIAFKEVKHRAVTSYHRDYENNECGKCWCYNGDIQCSFFHCYGPIPR